MNMKDIETIKSWMTSLNDKSLIKVVTEDYKEYDADALQLARQELESRSININENIIKEDSQNCKISARDCAKIYFLILWGVVMSVFVGFVYYLMYHEWASSSITGGYILGALCMVPILFGSPSIAFIIILRNKMKRDSSETMKRIYKIALFTNIPLALSVVIYGACFIGIIGYYFLIFFSNYRR